jgi:hypothetical protein
MRRPRRSNCRPARMACRPPTADRRRPLQSRVWHCPGARTAPRTLPPVCQMLVQSHSGTTSPGIAEEVAPARTSLQVRRRPQAPAGEARKGTGQESPLPEGSAGNAPPGYGSSGWSGALAGRTEAATAHVKATRRDSPQSCARKLGELRPFTEPFLGQNQSHEFW